MTKVAIKRVYEPAESSDGYRVLVDRLWPRDLRKEEVKYDVWAKGLAPSTPLRKWFHEDPDGRWDEFAARYRRELEESPEVKDFLAGAEGKSRITLVYGAKSPMHNHALILQEYLEKKL